METQDTNAWYQKTWLVIISCIIFFPVGLYALWKNSSINKGWKIAITIIIALIVIGNLSDSKKISVAEAAEVQPVSKTNPSATPGPVDIENEKAEAERFEITQKLKARARRDWPDDYSTQEFWVNQQLEDYEYMLTVEDNSIKSKAQKDWPLDFSTQKFWYNEQLEARERMN